MLSESYGLDVLLEMGNTDKYYGTLENRTLTVYSSLYLPKVR